MIDETDGPEPPEETPAATDASPDENELERRRSARKGSSVADRAANGETEAKDAEDDDGQFAFVVGEEGGRPVTLGQLVRRGTPTEVRYKMGGKSIPNVSGGLMDPYETNVLLVVDGVVDDVDVQFIRNDAQVIEKVIFYVSIKPRVVQNARTEAGRVLLGGEPAEHPDLAAS